MSQQDKNKPHESAALHVTGGALYVDDIPVHEKLLVGRVVWSPYAHAKILSFNLDAARKLKGVHAVLAAEDIPGKNNMGPVVHDEPVLAVDKVECIGQAVFVIAAETEEIAIQAEALIEISYQELEAILDIDSARKNGKLLQPERLISSGDCKAAMEKAPYTISGSLEIGGQEHWYLETQVCLCLPGEEKEMTAWSSTQHPTETQAVIAEVLGIPRNEVDVYVRRMGGAFGGKETQANHTAAWSALLSFATGRPVKIRLFRDDDQIITGKRHPYYIEYKLGFEKDGNITAYEVTLHADGGMATDLTMAVLERAMMHADNAYHIPNIQIRGLAWKTNTPSNTAFRGFGGPQGMCAIEIGIDRIAAELGIDSIEIRKKNYYREGEKTPYLQPVEHNRLERIHEELEKSADYSNRKNWTESYNTKHTYLKRGLSMTPVKFGISFTTSFLNQAGALVHIYRDGSVLVNHGGTEMGQGLHTKIAQIAALEFGVSHNAVKVNATHTAKVPNTSATAASAGTDLNGMAVRNAIWILKTRLAEFLKIHWQLDGFVLVEFENGSVSAGTHELPFLEVVELAYLHQVSLSTTGFYKTPDIWFDREKGQGIPYNYFCFGMAVSEVEVNILTGQCKLIRTDILHDVGDSLNPRIDTGQVEGGFIQGIGWCLLEDVKRDNKGNLLNHSPDTYKIPGVRDIPQDFRVKLLTDAPNPKAIRKSKAVAEPPFMLALSVWLAVFDALRSVKSDVEFNLPATPDRIVRWLH